ncbi:bcl-2-like protein 10 [Artibeus jamaicensis]|uniref:bcl-2-like protein 10 n=1 Tax=Artibeus jamaicensis TaxID=9417 RepID=UPI00235A8FBC|nr:bcl-2-like protein 10 [Artibeus jamaicensis]
MGDELRRRTAQLLADYLENCARVPGTEERQPSTLEAALLRYFAEKVQQRYQFTWSRFRGFRGNRLRLVADVARQIVQDRGFPSWGRVVVLVAFAGILLERRPQSHSSKLKGWKAEADVGSDCQRLVDFLCDWLTVEHRAWLEAQGGWDGFCCTFMPVVRFTWNTLLVRVLLSSFVATILTYMWPK